MDDDLLAQAIIDSFNAEKDLRTLETFMPNYRFAKFSMRDAPPYSLTELLYELYPNHKTRIDELLLTIAKNKLLA